MAEEKMTAAPAVTDEEKELLEGETQETSTAEEDDETTSEGEGEEKTEEKSYWQQQYEALEAKHNEELQAEEEKRKQLMSIKDKALQKEKEKISTTKEAWIDEAMTKWRREQSLVEARKAVSTLTEDKTAQKVILHHFQNLPSSLMSGDVEEDLQTALALANRKRITTLLSQESANDEQVHQSISSMGGGSSSSGSSFEAKPSATTREAARLASIYAGNDKEKAKRLSQRVQKFGR